MVNPQLENGYIKIANEVWRELCRYRIPGVERQVLDCILAKTYGFNKKMDRISLSQFVEVTGVLKPNIIASIKGLLLKGIIIMPKKGYYQFNKHYDSWLKLSKDITNKKLLKDITPVIKSDNKSLLKDIPTKDNTKDNIQKTERVTKIFFKGLTDDEKNKIVDNLKVPLKTVEDYCEQADAWSNGKGNKMLNWYLTIRNWINRDIKTGKVKRIIQNTVLNDEPMLSLEERKANQARFNEMRSKLSPMISYGRKT